MPYYVEIFSIFVGSFWSYLYSILALKCHTPGYFFLFLTQIVAIILDFISFIYLFIYIFFGDSRYTPTYIVGESGWVYYQCLGVRFFNSRFFLSPINSFIILSKVYFNEPLPDNNNYNELEDFLKKKKIEKKQNSRISSYITRILAMRILFPISFMLPFFITHIITGFFISIWTMISIPLLNYIYKLNKSGKSDDYGAWKFFFYIIGIILMFAIIFVAFHSSYQYAVLMYNGERWDTIFGIEYNSRSINNYLSSDKLYSTENLLYLIHIFI